MKRQGFTLIELLVSIALMVILLTAVTMIFVGTTETVAMQEARMTVYTNARYALDIFENDLLGCLALYTPPPPQPGMPPPQPGQQFGFQSFWMENGYLTTPGQAPSFNVSGGHDTKAGDRMSFRTTSGVGDTLQTCQVTYELIPGDMALDATGATVAGDSSHRQTVRTNRGLYTLVRRVRVALPTNPTVFDQVAQVKDKVTNQMVTVVDQELCHYVVSFNLEYYANNQQFSQLDPSPFPRGDPLGDGVGANDTSTPYRVPAIRVTIVIVEDIAERRERTIQKAMWIPQG